MTGRTVIVIATACPPPNEPIAWVWSTPVGLLELGPHAELLARVAATQTCTRRGLGRRPAPMSLRRTTRCLRRCCADGGPPRSPGGFRGSGNRSCGPC